MSEAVFSAILLTTIAGMSICLGALVAFFVKQTDKKTIAFALGFSAGLIIYVSLVEILFEAREQIGSFVGEHDASGITTLCFFGGILLTGLIDSLIHSKAESHDFRSVDEISTQSEKKRIARAGAMTAVAIAVHNFPEGIAIFISSLSEPAIGLTLAVAVALHNIPAGIAIAVPTYYGTGSRSKSMGYAFLAGIIQPIGAIAAYIILLPFITPFVLSCTFAVVAGTMIYISFVELIPSSYRVGEQSWSTAGIFAGMVVMALAMVFLH